MEEEDYGKLPVRDKCVHKLWKARLNGYEDAADLFRKLDEESPEWNKYSGLVKKFVTDSNAPAQEKGLEAALAFVENCAFASKTVSEVVNGLVQKCVSAPKAKTKELSIQLALKYIELEKQDVVLEELIKGTENKNPKISASCIHIINIALHEFGVKVINVNIVLKRMLVLLEDRDKSVRDEAKASLVELYRWMGPSLQSHLNGLKSSQLVDIQAEFEKLKQTEVKPKRLLKSQQIKSNQCENTFSPVHKGETKLVSSVPKIDPYELLDPIDILSDLPENFYNQLEAKKWSERKDALEGLVRLLSAAPKIEKADYSELVRILRKIIQKDNNIVVVGVAIKCITGLANGLKKNFNQYSSITLPCLLEKFKEKKPNIVTALREAVDAVYLSTNLEQILEDVIVFLENKNPNLKAEVASFLARCFHNSSPAALNKKLLKPLINALLIPLSDQDQTVRDNTAIALGVAMMVTGEKAIGPFLIELDNLKLAKIKECCEKAIQAKKQQNTDTTDAKIPNNSIFEVKSRSSPKQVSKRPDTGKFDAEKIAVIIPDDIRSDLVGHGENKIAAYNKLKDFIEMQEESKCLEVLKFLYKNDVKKTSCAEDKIARINVVGRIVKIIKIPKDMLEEIVLEIAGYLNHKETVEAASVTLNGLAEKFTLHCIAKLLLSTDLADQPTLWAEILRWISSTLEKEKDSVNSTLLMEYAKKALNQSDITVRNAAIALIGILHLQTGEIEVKGDEFSSHAEYEVETSKPVNKSVRITPLPVKTEITKDQVKCLQSDITEQLISDLMDKNWKTRSEAVIKLHSMVKDAGPIGPELGEVPPILAARLSDSNSKIAVATIALIESLAEGMGSNCKQHTSIFLSPLIKLIGDSKLWIRTAAISCLKKWYQIGGFREFFEGDLIADALKSSSHIIRTELWHFLAARLPNIPRKSLPKEELMACLPALFSNIEDRNSEVRKSACDSVLGFMIHLGFNVMNSAYEATKGSGNNNVKLLLEITRGSIPENLQPLKNKQESVDLISSGKKKALRSPPKKLKTTKSKENIKSANVREKTDLENELAPLLPINNLKNQRVIDEQKLKTLRWNFTTPRTEYVDLLKELMISANVNKNLIFNMFHSDFKHHLKAIDSLSENLLSNDLIPLTCNLDLILRWLSLRFFDTNPCVLLKSLDYLNTVFGLLSANGYQILDYEANSFIPYLILKFGDPKDSVRNSVRTLLKQISNMFPVTKLFLFIMEGIKSKNARQRTECLELLGWIIENFGMSVCQPNVPLAIREIASYIADRDTNVRNAAINCIVIAYFLEGEKVTKMVGNIAGKDMFLLEERIKRVSKLKPFGMAKSVNQLDEEASEVHVQKQNGVENSEVKAAMSISNSSSSREAVESNSSIFTEGSNLVTEQTVASLQSSKIEVNGPFSLDQQLLEDIEKNQLPVTQPHIVQVDMEFLKEPTVNPPLFLNQVTNLKPNLSQLAQKNALKREILKISDSDVGKAIESIGQIEMVLSTDKRIQLEGFIDLLIVQIVHQLLNLKQSFLPEDMTFYNAIFTLLTKLLNCPDLCKEVSENSVHQLLHHLILLLAKRRLQGYDRQDTIVNSTNIVILKCIEQLNKTNVLCAVIHLLCDKLNDLTIPSLYKELVLKSLWKLTKAQPDWDFQLDYKRVLLCINIFFKDYPSSWWKKQESEIPARTVRTLLLTMVRIRDVQVEELANSLPEVNQNSELCLYIKRLTRHVNTTNTVEIQPLPKQSTFDEKIELNSLQKEHELNQIFTTLAKGDSKEISDGIKKLSALKKAHPETNIDHFLSSISPYLKDCIEKALADNDVPSQIISKQASRTDISASMVTRQSSPSEINRGSKLTNENMPHLESSKYFKDEARRLWSRLQHLKELAGLPVDKRSLEDLCDNKESDLCSEVISD